MVEYCIDIAGVVGSIPTRPTIICYFGSFKFFSLDSGEKFEIETSGEKPQIVESIPGWAHYIKNIGDEELIVLLWANEIYDQNNPDTYYCEVDCE